MIMKYICGVTTFPSSSSFNSTYAHFQGREGANNDIVNKTTHTLLQ